MSPAPPDAWREVLAEDPGAAVTQTPEWFHAMRAHLHAVDVSRLYVLEDGRRLVLPLLRRSLLPGLFLDDSCSYGDLLATGGVRASDVRTVLSDLKRRGRVARTRLLSHYGNAEQWAAGKPDGVIDEKRVVHVLDLDGGFPRVWQEGFDRSARWSIRKAERSGVVIERDTTGKLTPVFYDVYTQWLEDKARQSEGPRTRATTLVGGHDESPDLFEAVASGLGEACRQWVAWHKGVPVAVHISLVYGQHSMSWRSYSRKELAAPLRANNLLQKLAIEDACAAGCRFYSMGQSGGVPSLEHFKEGLGARPQPAVEYHIERLPLTRLAALARGVRAGAAMASDSLPRAVSRYRAGALD